jgi:hypothetical protein
VYDIESGNKGHKICVWYRVKPGNKGHKICVWYRVKPGNKGHWRQPENVPFISHLYTC